MALNDLLSSSDFERELAQAGERLQARRTALDAYARSGSIALFGYGGKGRALARHLGQHDGVKLTVFDSSADVRARATQEGFATVSRLDALPAGIGVILGACQAQAEQAGIVKQNYLYYQEAAWLFDAPHLADRTRAFGEWIAANKQGLYALYSSVHESSRRALLDVLRFRLSQDPTDLSASRRPNVDMWFDVLGSHAKRTYTTLLDVGAYDGDTLAAARRRLLTRRGIAVEANPSLVGAIEANTRDYPDGIQLIPFAAWSHACRLRFDEVRGGMISVSEASDGELAAKALDDCVDESIDLIKMDIEGAEVPALRGCKRLLSYSPDLAIASYHRPDDLLRIPELLKTADYDAPGFDLHVAHYSDCLDDTILYFLKR